MKIRIRFRRVLFEFFILPYIAWANITNGMIVHFGFLKWYVEFYIFKNKKESREYRRITLAYTWEDGCRFCSNNIDISDKVYKFDRKEAHGFGFFPPIWYSCKLDKNIMEVANRIPPEKCPLRRAGND